MNFLSTLNTKPILKTIKPSKLGYVRPDGTIKFQSPEAANTYAKNVVVKALNAQKPYEMAVLIDDSTIVKQIAGNSENVHMKIKKNIAIDTMVHGHPDRYGKGNTSSFSPQDIRFLFTNPLWELEKLIVYNSKGESSTIVKNPYPEKIFKLPVEKWDSFFLKEYEKAGKIIDKMSDDIQNQGMETAQKLLNCGEFFQNFVKDLPFTTDKAAFFSNVSGKIAAITGHDVLNKYAKKLGIKYKTNFSNLK